MNFKACMLGSIMGSVIYLYFHFNPLFTWNDVVNYFSEPPDPIIVKLDKIQKTLDEIKNK